MISMLFLVLINRVLYISIHRYEYGVFWPHLRESDYDNIGKDKGKGFNVNVPLNQVRNIRKMINPIFVFRLEGLGRA